MLPDSAGSAGSRGNPGETGEAMTTFGAKLKQLMAKRGFSQRQLANAVPCDNGYLSKVARGLRAPSADLAERLDQLLDADGELVALRPSPPTPVPGGSADDAVALADWLEQSEIGDGAINYLETASRRLAFDYPRRPPLEVLDEARRLQLRLTHTLRNRRQRLGQTQALLTTSAEIFALISLLAGDVGRYSLADAYGYAAWTCANEADSDSARALVLCAQSKTARWKGQYTAAAELARRGFDLVPAGARGRVLLAVSEATALQSSGAVEAAYGALGRAREARNGVQAVDEATDAWSCPRARLATYALQVGLGARDTAAMLRSVQAADDAWADGDARVYGTWAQVRIGAALAHVMMGETEGAAEQLAPVFNLGLEYRVVTITGRTGEVAQRLGHSRYEGDPRAGALVKRIRAFQSGSLQHQAITCSEPS
ncbi:helix-turn-helix domain-containing protein [Spirillospora sp. NPDC047279]|uniref:helix-turn-helix domain-containing protein n=1 Tax=Spirillospora sp. NPDC047279 TaxID=3155478 RepID=UPI0033E429E0